jgi:flagellar hook assembly protein FlgD
VDLIIKNDSAVIGLIQGQYTYAENTVTQVEQMSSGPFLAPNPFNPGTKVHFGSFVNNMLPVQLEIFSANGRLLHRSILPAGSKTANWNGCDTRGNGVGNGIYLFRVVSGNSVKKIRGILVK